MSDTSETHLLLDKLVQLFIALTKVIPLLCVDYVGILTLLNSDSAAISPQNIANCLYFEKTRHLMNQKFVEILLHHFRRSVSIASKNPAISIFERMQLEKSTSQIDALSNYCGQLNHTQIMIVYDQMQQLQKRMHHDQCRIVTLALASDILQKKVRASYN